MNSKRITVFTPTFNRAYIIHKLYHSLLDQQFLNFEWLIVDDGSTDETKELVDQWIVEAPFTIRYYKQSNGGKHRAVNRGLDLAQGEIFFVVDSDDRLTADALLKIDEWFRQISNKPELKGIVANKGVSDTKTINSFFSSEYLDKSLLDMSIYQENGKNVLNGERAIAFYTDFHKKYKFPEFEGEKFLTEAIVYNRMANDGYKMRFYNDIIWVYEYQPNGLSANGTDIYLQNPRGYGLWFKERAKFLHYSVFKKWKMWYSFYCDLKDKHSVQMIAGCIGAPRIAIHFCKMIFQILHVV